LVASGDASSVHSVLMQHQTDFTIYLPPMVAASHITKRSDTGVQPLGFASLLATA
jgi:hypothetical protein